ncbi:MAG: hypothetical protein KDA81_04295 [Planctomycetaceae bacterium]|nr:hypothetical protein [Planctomycetaceae bacterium]
MNYLAHGFRFLDNPLFLAGTAVPDWLSVVDRKARARRKLVQPIVSASDCRHTRDLGRGILQHHTDDDAFHRSETFQVLEARLSRRFREIMPDPFDHRPGFLGHIIIELLLDATLAHQNPHLLDQYYAALAQIDAAFVEQTVNQMVTRPTDQLGWFIHRFHEERFLYDYSDDIRLLRRLNQVMKRVHLPEISDDAILIISKSRIDVAAAMNDLIAPVIENSTDL